MTRAAVGIQVLVFAIFIANVRSQSTPISGIFEDNLASNIAATWTTQNDDADRGQQSANTSIYYHGPYLPNEIPWPSFERAFSCPYDAVVNIGYKIAYRYSNATDFIALYVDDELRLDTNLSLTESFADDPALLLWADIPSVHSFYQHDLALDNSIFVLAATDFTVKFEVLSRSVIRFYHLDEQKFVGNIRIECAPITPTEIDTVYIDNYDLNHGQLPFVWNLESYTLGDGYDASVQQSTSTSTWYHGPFQGSAVNPISRISRDFRCSSDSFVIVSYVAAFCGTQYSDTLELLFNGQSLILTHLQLDAMDSRVSADSEQLKAWDIHCSFNADFRTLDRVQTSDALSVAAGEVFTIEFKVDADWSTEVVFIGDIQIECSDSIPTTTTAGATTTTTTTATSATTTTRATTTSVSSTGTAATALTATTKTKTTTTTTTTSAVASRTSVDYNAYESPSLSPTEHDDSLSGDQTAKSTGVIFVSAIGVVFVAFACSCCGILYRYSRKQKRKVSADDEYPQSMSTASSVAGFSITGVQMTTSPLNAAVAAAPRVVPLQHSSHSGAVAVHPMPATLSQTTALRPVGSYHLSPVQKPMSRMRLQSASTVSTVDHEDEDVEDLFGDNDHDAPQVVSMAPTGGSTATTYGRPTHYQINRKENNSNVQLHAVTGQHIQEEDVSESTSESENGAADELFGSYVTEPRAEGVLSPTDGSTPGFNFNDD